MKLLIVALVIVISCTACTWHFRNPSEVPPSLRQLYLNTEDIDSHFRTHILSLFHSMKISLAPTPAAAPLTLNLYDYSLIHNNPSISTTDVAITYTFTLKVTVSISDSHGKTIVPAHLIHSTRQITVNTNQIFTINSTQIFQEELQREAINLIYYWLISDQVRRHLHADPSSTTQPTS